LGSANEGSRGDTTELFLNMNQMLLGLAKEVYESKVGLANKSSEILK